MELFKKRKFRLAICFLVSYLSLVAFSLASTNRAPVRNNESLILTDFSTGFEIENIPYGNYSFESVLKDNLVLHAPVSFMSGESFHVKFEASLSGVPEAEVVTDLSAGEYDMSACSFTSVLHEGENVVEGDLFFDNIEHPASGEINIYSITKGAEITITKPHFSRIENKRVGFLAYTALTISAVFFILGVVMLIKDRAQAYRELKEYEKSC
ncbi:hypothetical protein [Butyrivibrio sp. FC2001]|uniref:hypothetical protein n=1 Tax=Butyrivibrio sp. FC2001 TaxID=1280671 RepID=UPI000408BA06|nr:hypothetical protein [Butyrivibrio sp. FC2001]